jgi:hypothetical protein
MAVDFGYNEGNRYVNFATGTSTECSTGPCTVTFWCLRQSPYSQLHYLIIHGYIGSNGWRITYEDRAGSTQGLELIRHHNIAKGLWNSELTFSKDVWTFVAVAWTNPGGTINKPEMYVNDTYWTGVPTEYPNGSYLDGADVKLGSHLSSDPYYSNCQIQDVRIYNRQLTAAEIKEIHHSRFKCKLTNGLLFHAPLIGAAGVQNFDGTSLASGNTLLDEVGKYAGVPNGVVTGRASICE